MAMSMADGGAMPSAMPTAGPGLSDAGLDMENYTVAVNFLQTILDDTDLQPYDWRITGIFWYGVVVVIGIATLLNLIRWFTLKTRLRAAAAKRTRPAKDSNSISSCYAAITTIVREITYPQITPSRSRWLRIPPFGALIFVLAYVGFIFGLLFSNSIYPGAQYWEDIGLRASWLTVAQFPLLLLLAGKNNLIGFLVGVSYERLQIFHRWVARAMLLTATLHGGYQTYGWNHSGVLQIEIGTDTCVPTGFATWILLIWLVFSATGPFRHLSYEFFVIQHIISFVGFLVAIFYHIPSNALNARIFVWLAIGFFVLDRLIRYCRSAYNNSKPAKASLTSLPGDVTRVTLQAPRLRNWQPGQHVFLCIPKLGFSQSHPATIASIPSSHKNELIFLLKAHKGFTRRLLTSANTSSKENLLDTSEMHVTDIEAERFTALIDGPYGSSYSDFAAFDTTVFIAGSTGVTFTLPILLDIAHRASINRLPVRSIIFIWMIKSTDWASWIAIELQIAAEMLHSVGIEIQIRIFLTCDSSFTEESEDIRKCGCDCDVRVGACCCEEPPESPDSSSQVTGIEVDTLVPTTEKPESITPSPSLQAKKGISTVRKGSTQNRTTLRKRLLQFATLQSGRPNFKALLWEVLDQSQGETGIAVCGPAGLSCAVRNTVAAVSDQRAAAKGTGAGGIYLHSECYHW